MITRNLRPVEIQKYAPQLLWLQHAAYAVEAALIEDDRIPALHESERDLLSAPLSWVAMFDGDTITAAIGYTIDNDLVDIDRLMVNPTYQRQGLGKALVSAVIGLTKVATVATGMKNTPARKLYESLGFVHDADTEPVPGLWVSQYSRKSPSPTRT